MNPFPTQTLIPLKYNGGVVKKKSTSLLSNRVEVDGFVPNGKLLEAFLRRRYLNYKSSKPVNSVLGIGTWQLANSFL